MAMRRAVSPSSDNQPESYLLPPTLDLMLAGAAGQFRFCGRNENSD